MKVFTELGNAIESRWSAVDYNNDSFSQIACAALSEAKLTSHVDPWEIIRWVQSSSTLPRQQDLKAKFGNPPITVFNGPRFYVDVYYWLDGTTSIHQHSFSGAFQLLAGSSIHCQYRFEKDREVTPHFLTGKLNLDRVSLVQPDQVCPISAGDELIHSLFHLERPSISVVARTTTSPRSSVQFSYLKPFIAYDPFFEDPVMLRKTQTASLLLKVQHPETDAWLAEMLKSSDFHTSFLVLDIAYEILANSPLEELFSSSRGNDRFQALLDVVRTRHGESADLLVPVFEEKRREADLTMRRAKIFEPHHRFLLGLLLMIPHKQKLLELLVEKFPGTDPVETFVRFLRELLAKKIFGSNEPNVLGLKNVDDLDLLVLEKLLRDEPDDQILHDLSQRQDSHVPVRERLDRLRKFQIFRPLLNSYNHQHVQ